MFTPEFSAVVQEGDIFIIKPLEFENGLVVFAVFKVIEGMVDLSKILLII